jgi:hypothetical protein
MMKVIREDFFPMDETQMGKLCTRCHFPLDEDPGVDTKYLCRSCEAWIPDYYLGPSSEDDYTEHHGENTTQSEIDDIYVTYMDDAEIKRITETSDTESIKNDDEAIETKDSINTNEYGRLRANDENNTESERIEYRSNNDINMSSTNDS